MVNCIAVVPSGVVTLGATKCLLPGAKRLASVVSNAAEAAPPQRRSAAAAAIVLIIDFIT